MTKKILYLPIKLYWLKRIVSGKKTKEYRKIKHYYISRLFNKDGSVRIYDEVWLRAGYNKDSPLVKCKWNGWEVDEFLGHNNYAIDVSEILSVDGFNKLTCENMDE